jgi:hypothetical protein
MKLWHTFPPLAVLPLLLLAAPAHAQLNLSLLPASQAGNPGDTLNFTGMLSNPTAASDPNAYSVFLNSDSPTFNGPGTIDATPFFTNAPASLDPAGTMDANGNLTNTDTYNGPFFDITLDPNAAPGTYNGTFTILGGADGNASDTVATQDFSVTVLPAAVPEASSVVSLGVLLALGLGGLVVSTRRRKSAAL